MLRQLCRNVIPSQRSSGSILKCLDANYCSNPNDFNEGELYDEVEHTGTSLGKEFSFCHVTLLGRVGAKPRLIETEKTKFTSLMIGINSRIAPMKEFTKWHEVHVNDPVQQKQLLKNIQVGDRVYVRGNMSYVQDDQFVKKYRIYSDFVRLVSHSQKYWDNFSEEQKKEEEK